MKQDEKKVDLKVVEIPLAKVKKPVKRTVTTYHPRKGYIKKEVTE